MSKSVATAVDESADSVLPKRAHSTDSIKTASDLSIGSPAAAQKSDGSIQTQSGVSIERGAQTRSDRSSAASIQTESGASVNPPTSTTATSNASMAEDLPPDESAKSSLADYSLSFDGSDSDISKLSDASSDKSSVISSVVSHPKLGGKDSDSKAIDDSFTRLSSEMLRQQLRDEEVRAQQQAALFKLREKALTEKTRANLQLLEHEKRRLKEKGDEDGLLAIRRQQKLLLTKLQQEQVWVL